MTIVAARPGGKALVPPVLKVRSPVIGPTPAPGGFVSLSKVTYVAAKEESVPRAGFVGTQEH